MQTEKPNFPIPEGSCKDCGHAHVGTPPPVLGRPLPSQGLHQQTPSATAASARIECFKVIWNRKWRWNFMSSTRPPRTQRPGGGFPNDHDDDDDEDDEDDDGHGVNPRRRPRVIGWCHCDICKKNAECLRCEDYKIKRQGASDGGGGPPDVDPDDYYGGEGKPNWPRGRRDRESRKRKPTNPHDLSALELKLIWDTWQTQVSHTFNLWSSLAAQTFQRHLKDAQERHAQWNQLPNAQKLQFERQYIYGLGQLPPIQEFLEGHMRHSLTQAIPPALAVKLDAYGQYAVPDILFPVMRNFRLMMSEEVNHVPFDKTTITFAKAITVWEKWIQKYEVPRKYKAHIEPQKMIVIITKITQPVRNSDGVPDQFFGIEFHGHLMSLGVRDNHMHLNVELLAKQVLVLMRNRVREMSTSKVALGITLGTKGKPSALAADADHREQDANWKQKLSKMTCKFFLSNDGCKKGRLCETRHAPISSV
eukprot:376047-Amphidinium_carterae.2